ncbi:hypothetical protein F5883DRAFT_556550 [Diaporthe sp. PMI_573]|nr:hypothetical protein F5883DRAFT_556550 [Diaporthaceae sp. PMI_573]
MAVMTMMMWEFAIGLLSWQLTVVLTGSIVRVRAGFDYNLQRPRCMLSAHWSERATSSTQPTSPTMKYFLAHSLPFTKHNCVRSSSVLFPLVTVPYPALLFRETFSSFFLSFFPSTISLFLCLPIYLPLAIDTVVSAILIQPSLPPFPQHHTCLFTRYMKIGQPSEGPKQI